MQNRISLYRIAMACAFAASLWLAGCATLPMQSTATVETPTIAAANQELPASSAMSKQTMDSTTLIANPSNPSLLDMPVLTPIPALRSANPDAPPRMALSLFDTAYIDKDGTLWAWGLNKDGMLGLGHAKKQPLPAKVATDVRSVAIADMQPVEVINPSHGAMFFIRKDNTLWVSGYNNYGVFGDGTTQSCTKPRQVMGDVRSIHIAQNGVRPFVFVIKTNGELWYWGPVMKAGRLQDGFLTPQKLWSDVRDVIPGVWMTYFITSKNELICFATSKEHVGTEQRLSITYTKTEAPDEKMDEVLYAAKNENLGYLVLRTDGKLWSFKDIEADGFRIRLENIAKCLVVKSTAVAIDKAGILYMWKFSPFYLDDPKAIMANVHKVALSSQGAFPNSKASNDFTEGMKFYVLDNQGIAYESMTGQTLKKTGMENIIDVYTENGRVYFIDAENKVYVKGDIKNQCIGTLEKSAKDRPAKLVFK